MPTVGQDCHVSLSHAAINGGAACGFLLEAESEKRAPSVVVQRETDSDGVMHVRVFFTVLLADGQLNPDGSPHTPTRSQEYAALLRYLEQSAGVALQDSFGVFSNLGALGYCASEAHYPLHGAVTCQFNNSGPYFAPADPAAFNASLWDGGQSWANSFWR